MHFANLLGALDGPDLLIILVIVLLLFGGAKLPQLARSLGQAKREFHEGANATGEQPSEGADTVTISRAELDRLQAASADQPAPQQEPPATTSFDSMSHPQ